MLDAARRMLGGERLYADLIDLNPPFVFWLSEPAVLASRLGLHAADAFRVLVLGILAGMLALAWPLTRQAPALRLGFVLFALALPLGHFGEREHLIFGLILPYVALAAARAEGENPSRRLAIAAGIAAGIALAIKPPAALAPLLITAWPALRERSLRPFLRPEQWAALATLLVALGLLLAFAPAYLDAVRAFGPLYAEFSRGTLRQLLLRDIYSLSVWLALVVTIVGIGSVAPWRRLMVLALASGGFLAAAAAQGKGFGYHYFPAMGFAVVTLLELLTAPAPAGEGRRVAVRRTLAATALLLVLVLPVIVAAERLAGKEGSDVRERRALSGALADLGPGAPVAIISVRLGDAYPILLDRKWEHVLSMPHVWFTGLTDGEAARTLWRRVGTDIAAGRPAAVVVRAPLAAERTRGDREDSYLTYLCADSAGRAAMAGYARAAHAGGYDIYRPQQEGVRACASS